MTAFVRQRAYGMAMHGNARCALAWLQHEGDGDLSLGHRGANDGRLLPRNLLKMM
jgi:hypothetical protein